MESSQYYTALGKVSQQDFTSSSVAYGFQVSTIYPFILWGASGFLLVPLVNTVFWGIGILLFTCFLHKIKISSKDVVSVHGFLGKHFGRRTQLTSASLALVGFIGLMVAELWFGSQVLNVFQIDKSIQVVILFSFLFLVSAYLYKYGQLSSIVTDKIQLFFIYLFIVPLIIRLVFWKEGNSIASNGQIAIILLAILTFLVLIARNWSFQTRKNSFSRAINSIYIILMLSLLSSILYFLLMHQNVFTKDSFFNLEGFGGLGLLTLMLLPLVWQFVDTTNWQRLYSVSQIKESNNSLKKGLLSYAIESPFTWILFLVLGVLSAGLASKHEALDIFFELPKILLSSGSTIDHFLGVGYILGVLMVMMSTIDSFFMALGFTVKYDFLQVKDHSYTSNVPVAIKLIPLGAISLSLTLLLIIDSKEIINADVIITMLFSFYSAMVALFVPVMIALYRNKVQRCNSYLVQLSILLPALLGISIGIYSTLVDPSWGWYPVPFTLGASILLNLVFYPFAEGNR